MKIICPEHNGLIEIKESDLVYAFKNPMQSTVLICPVCKEEVIIHNVCMENEHAVFQRNAAMPFRKQVRLLH